MEAQERAKGANKGLWADDAATKVRKVTWDVENTRELVERFKVMEIISLLCVEENTSFQIKSEKCQFNQSLLLMNLKVTD